MQDRDLESVVDHVIQMRKGLGREGLSELVRAMKAAGGTYQGVAQYDPDGPICPEFKIPFPPKPQPLADLFSIVWKYGSTIVVFPRGIINPEFLHVIVRNIGPV